MLLLIAVVRCSCLLCVIVVVGCWLFAVGCWLLADVRCYVRVFVGVRCLVFAGVCCCVMLLRAALCWFLFGGA